MINKVRRKNVLLLGLALASLSLSSCGAQDSGYRLALEEGGSIQYQFGEAFHEGSLGIYHSGDKAAEVTANMLQGFYTNVLTFDQDLTAEVVYQKAHLPLTYRVSSTYSLDKEHYTVGIERESLSVTLIGNPSKTDTEFTVPASIDTLPDPLKSWPVLGWKASFGGLSALKKVHLSKVLESFAPSVIDSALAILPYSSDHSGEAGVLDYDSEGFLLLDSVLWGINPQKSGALVLPSQASSFKPNAFATPLEGVTSLEIPASYTDLDFSKLSKNLPHNQAFIASAPAPGNSIKDGAIRYTSGRDTFIRGIPLGRYDNAASMRLPEGITRFLLPTIDGFTLSAAKDLILPTTLTSFSAAEALTSSVLETLELTSPNLVDANAFSISNLPSSLKTIKVPSSLLSSYQADSAWGQAKASFVAA